jgi:hypothetical protein
MDRQEKSPRNNWPGRFARGRRFDRNPLRRASDRVESGALIGLLVMFGGGAPVVAAACGSLVHGIAERNMLAEQAARYQVTARVLTTAEPSPLLGELPEPTARWTAPDGHLVAGSIPVPIGTTVGTRVSIWVTRTGQLTEAPLAPSQVAEQADNAEVLGVLGYAAVLGGIGLLGRRALDRRRMAAWDADWLASGTCGLPRT